MTAKTASGHGKRMTARGWAALGCAGAVAVFGAGCAARSGAVSPVADQVGSATPAPLTSTGSAGSTPPVVSPAPGAEAADPAAGTSTRCHTADLSGTFTAVPDSVAAGNIVYNIKLTNTSTRTCTVYGHPGLLLQNAQHAALPTHVDWNSMVPDRLITLKPGQAVSASARFSPDVAGTGDTAAPGAACEPTADFTEITPPDETAHLVVSVRPATPVCEAGTMAVSPFVAGASGPGES